jgi:hypothetical protein
MGSFEDCRSGKLLQIDSKWAKPTPQIYIEWANQSINQ